MATRQFLIEHGSSTFDLVYDTNDGFDVLFISFLFIFPFLLIFSIISSIIIALRLITFQVFQFQIFSLTSVPPDQQKILGVDDNRNVSNDSDLELVCDKLRLVSIDEDESSKEIEILLVNSTVSDEELARRLQAEEEALMMQQFVTSEYEEKFEQKIRPYIDQVIMYEDPYRREAALKTVPVDKLELKAMVALAREGNFTPTKDESNHAFLLQLLFWFKQSFRWVNKPPCDNCNNDTVQIGMGNPNHSETNNLAAQVELYSCKSCSKVTRFPRYNDPLKLLETRKGRCGEWANCFTLYCRTFGYESRLVLDFTDHVWTECFSPYLGRWMHLDPCEGIYDNPLLYEKGWNKKLNYIFGISHDGVSDVTKRYSRKWPKVLSRRNMISERALATTISNFTRECRRKFTSEMCIKLEERDRNEADELETNLYSKDDVSISLPGRQSGDEVWRISRSEFGSDSLSSSSCPVRRCVDEHVTKIYNAFSPIIYQLAEQEFDKLKATEVLHTFKRIMVSLIKSPFRTMRAMIKAEPANSLFIKMLNCFGQLLDALSLKIELGIDGTTDICLASDPVKTCVALPVFFHAIDDLIHNVNIFGMLQKESLSWPLLKLNRICSGFVLASGEELPFGIAMSAFDGTRMSKWEEPNGATGCWITYKVSDNQMHELVSYELMSANDAPERDPMDWIIEGSEDGGSSWRILDKQTSQKFDQRFQRKTFEVKSQSFLANAFRLRILAVCDVKSTSRFQIGSIDLYARTTGASTS